MLPPRDPSQIKRNTQTNNKGMGKDTLQMERKKNLG